MLKLAVPFVDIYANMSGGDGEQRVYEPWRRRLPGGVIRGATS